MDLDFTQLLGDTVPTQVTLGTALNQTLPLPIGTFLEFNQSPIKGTYAATGLAGVCTDAFAGGAGAAEPLITSGTCGTRTAWGLYGDLLISDIPISAFAGGLSGINYSSLLTQIIPVLKKLNSSVERDVQFRLNTPPARLADGGYDSSEFTPYNHDVQQVVPLGFGYVLKLPSLPKFSGNYADGVLALAGATVPGRGVVPLGLGAAVNTTGASTTDIQAGLPSTGLMVVREAPTHHGIEGDQYAVMVLALSLKSLSSASAGLATSALFPRLPNNKLVFDITGANPMVIPGAFIVPPEGAKFNFAGRTFQFRSAPSTTGSNVYRVEFSDASGHRWVITGDVGSPSFSLPVPPAGFDDRIFTNSAQTTQSTYTVQLVGLNSDPANGGTAISFSQLAELGSTNANRLTDFTTAFAAVAYSAPTVSWTTPNAGNATISASTPVAVTVSNFMVGASAGNDGYVQLSFTGGSGCGGTANGQAADSSGKVAINIPAGCSGSAITMTATLVDINGLAISPSVSASVTGITIN
jgi:hypothetical protein